MAADSASNDQSTYSLWCGVAGHHRKQVRKIRSSARANFAHRFYILYVCNYIHTLLFGEAYPCFASSLGLFFCRAQLRKIEAAAMLQTLLNFIAAAAVVI